MRKTLITVATALVLAGAAQAAEQQARIEVSGLWCPSCSYIVGKAFQESASVEIVEFEEREGGESGVFTITFDDAQTDLSEIVARPETYGYQATLLEDAPQS